MFCRWPFMVRDGRCEARGRQPPPPQAGSTEVLGRAALSATHEKRQSNGFGLSVRSTATAGTRFEMSPGRAARQTRGTNPLVNNDDHAIVATYGVQYRGPGQLLPAGR